MKYGSRLQGIGELVTGGFQIDSFEELPKIIEYLGQSGSGKSFFTKDIFKNVEHFNDAEFRKVCENEEKNNIYSKKYYVLNGSAPEVRAAPAGEMQPTLLH